MLGVPHKAKKCKSSNISKVESGGFGNVPLLLLGFTPGPPIILEIISSLLQGWRADTLTIAAPDEVDQ